MVPTSRFCSSLLCQTSFFSPLHNSSSTPQLQEISKLQPSITIPFTDASYHILDLLVLRRQSALMNGRPSEFTSQDYLSGSLTRPLHRIAAPC
ncbi:hypothetical protein BD289DRAFT_440341 [Coniella lustricola]|uniref:Uncharacterized protein n=1 Tax=Coniella lustricola TaxID=2025994 RepID=A0A2T3A0L5_9PEZI|nr:hypothetical protein BD289DRAFT_440341 [Coniella lustricola]